MLDLEGGDETGLDPGAITMGGKNVQIFLFYI